MKIETEQTISMVEELRKIRDKIGIEIQDLTHEQLMEYFNRQETFHPKAVWKKQREPKQENK